MMQAGELEIYSFLPGPFLRKYEKRRDKMDVGEFIGWLAKARYLAEIRQISITNAIIQAFNPENET